VSADLAIARIDVFRLKAQLRQEFAFSQFSYSSRESTLVRMETRAGLVGWGEGYGPPAPIAAAVEHLFAPMLAGQDAGDVEESWRLMFARSLDFGQKGVLLAAISALDIACWDLKAQAAGVPLYRLLGSSRTESIPCYATGFYFGGDGPLERRFAREAEAYVRQGFTAMKMKVGLGVERDAVLVGAVRQAIGSGVRLMIDANHAFDPVSAIALGRRVERHDLHWFEEPVSPLDIGGMLEVKQRLSIPIAAGECEFTRFGFEPLLRRRAIDFAQPDLCACGGITEGWKIAVLASIHQIHLTPHAWGSPVGQAAALHFYAARPRHPGSLTAEDKLIECDRTENPLRERLARQPIELQNGSWMIPQEPGLGIEVDEDQVRAFQVG